MFSPGTAQAQIATDTNTQNSQNTPILQATPTIDPTAKTDSTVEIVDNSALVAESGPLGTAADINTDTSTSDQISVYVVHKGDTIAAIAAMFDVSTNTVMWANNLSKGQALIEGTTLVILPVTGVQYTIKKGDTISSIAKKLNADAGDIATFNGIAVSALLIAGETIIIPNGEIAAAPAAKATTKVSSKVIASSSGPAHDGYYIKPVACVRTQGIHGHNGVDLGCSVGTSIKAAAKGTVIVANNSGGWNGGYGNYVVISHPNGTQTLYAHLSKVSTSVGNAVGQGELIGYTGGRPGSPGAGSSTGPHLHFEVRGAKNPGADGTWAN
jgi:LysM repeat protein